MGSLPFKTKESCASKNIAYAFVIMLMEISTAFLIFCLFQMFCHESINGQLLLDSSGNVSSAYECSIRGIVVMDDYSMC